MKNFKTNEKIEKLESYFESECLEIREDPEKIWKRKFMERWLHKSEVARAYFVDNGIIPSGNHTIIEDEILDRCVNILNYEMMSGIWPDGWAFKEIAECLFS